MAICIILLVVPIWLWGAWLHHRVLVAEDCILSSLYETRRDIWESLGSPGGWRWSPPGASVWQMAAWSFPYEWYKTDPDWLVDLPQLQDTFERLRVCRYRRNHVAAPAMAFSFAFFAIVAIVSRNL
jgi:hypothetical protein